MNVQCLPSKRGEIRVSLGIWNIPDTIFKEQIYIGHQQKEIHFNDWIIFFYVVSEKAGIHNIRMHWYILILNIINILNNLGKNNS